MNIIAYFLVTIGIGLFAYNFIIIWFKTAKTMINCLSILFTKEMTIMIKEHWKSNAKRAVWMFLGFALLALGTVLLE